MFTHSRMPPPPPRGQDAGVWSPGHHPTPHLDPGASTPPAPHMGAPGQLILQNSITRVLRRALASLSLWFLPKARSLSCHGPSPFPNPKDTFLHPKLVAVTVTILALHVPQVLLLHALSPSLLLPPCPQPLLASYSPGCCFYPLLLGPAHSPLASQGLGPHLLAPPLPPPPGARGRLPPGLSSSLSPGEGGTKGPLSPVLNWAA